MAISGVDPNTVDSPRKNWRTYRLLLWDKGAEGDEGGYAIALGTWDNLDGEGPRPVVGLRWNGSRHHKLGNPQSRGLPTWFAVPDDLALGVIDVANISERDKKFAKEFLKR